MSKLIDLTGKRFGKLTVIKQIEERKHGKVQWLCKCDCGNEKAVAGYMLKNGSVRSCGCLMKEVWKKTGERQLGQNSHFYKHGLSQHKLNGIYRGIKKRCYCKNEPAYKNYGGRGIYVAEEWLSDFMSFYNWANENGYQEGLTLDRIDNNGPYAPWNCRWVDRKTQSNNKRTNVWIDYKGERHTMAQWGEITGISKKKIWKRLNTGWSVERTLSTK